MTNLSKLEFNALELNGSNYLTWVLDAEMHLDANELGDTIKEENKASTQSKGKAMILLRHHLSKDLKAEYLTVKDPCVLWKSFKDRYDHLKSVILPQAQYDWLHLRFQDFKSVLEYNSAMLRITSQLKLCGENVTENDMLEKTYTTFHASNMLLQQQFRERKFTKYSELIACLLVAEKNNELLMKNHHARLTGTTAIPEVNAVNNHENIERGKRGHNNNNTRGRGRGRGRAHGGGRGSGQYFRPKNTYPQRDRYNVQAQNQNVKNTWYRCGGKGHWSCICRTRKHLVELYQKSRPKSEVHLVGNTDPGRETTYAKDTTQLDINDFYVDSHKE